MSAVPVLVHAERVRVLVVGGGTVGTRKALAFHEAGASVHVVAPRLDDALRSTAAASTRLRLSEREFARDDVQDAELVIAATDDRAVNARVATAAGEAGRLVNVTDAPDHGSFSTVAAHRAGPLVIGVGAGGVPAAAARIRDDVAARYDGRYADALAALGALRSRLLAAGARDAWRRASDALTGAEFVELVESGRFLERVRRWA